MRNPFANRTGAAQTAKPAAKAKPAKARTSSTRVMSASRDHAQELSVLWWRWRHCFLAAKQIELHGSVHDTTET